MTVGPFKVKDADQQDVYFSEQADAQGNWVPLHVPGSVVDGIATPVSQTNPLPVEVSAGSPAVDGSGTVVSATVAQTLFAGVVPVNGFQFANNCASVIFISDTRTAGPNIGMPVAVGGIYTTPSGYKPAGPVSVFGGTTSGNFDARKW
jgi:hypothetical protein